MSATEYRRRISSAYLLDEAREWIVDTYGVRCYDYDDARDILNQWPPERVRAAIEKHYLGGWNAFERACGLVTS